MNLKTNLVGTPLWNLSVEARKITATLHAVAKPNVKFVVFALNYAALQKLNYQTMKENILKELDDPQDQRTNIDIVTPDFFDRNQTTKKIRLIERDKKYGLVFDKRLLTKPPASPHRTVTTGLETKRNSCFLCSVFSSKTRLGSGCMVAPIKELFACFLNKLGIVTFHR